MVCPSVREKIHAKARGLSPLIYGQTMILLLHISTVKDHRAYMFTSSCKWGLILGVSESSRVNCIFFKRKFYKGCHCKQVTCTRKKIGVWVLQRLHTAPGVGFSALLTHMNKTSSQNVRPSNRHKSIVSADQNIFFSHFNVLLVGVSMSQRIMEQRREERQRQINLNN